MPELASQTYPAISPKLFAVRIPQSAEQYHWFLESSAICGQVLLSVTTAKLRKGRCFLANSDSPVVERVCPKGMGLPVFCNS